MKTLAIFGGTFDPFHSAHLYIACEAAKFFQCAVRIIPGGAPPHRRQPVAAWQHRLAMCRQAAAPYRDISVGEEEPPSQICYTAHTLTAIKQRLMRTTLLLILGSDAYAAMDNWYRPDIILSLAHLVVVQRPQAAAVSLHKGTPIKNKAALSAGCGGVYSWPCRPPPISAADCRAKLAANQTLNDALPPAVSAYIRKHQLYRE